MAALDFLAPGCDCPYEKALIGTPVPMPRKTVRIHYRRFLRGSEPAINASLAASVSASFRHQVGGIPLSDDVRLRTYEDADHGTIILNGLNPLKSGDVFGEFVRIDPTANISLLVQNGKSAAELEVREMAKPNDAEVLKGMSFFLIRGDHVLVIEQDLTSSMMERYLRWLLCERCTIAQRNVPLKLIPKLFLDEKVENLRDVSLVRLKPAPMQPPGFDFDDADTTIHSEKGVSATTSIMAILRAANFDTALIDTLMRRSGASLQLNLDITLKAGRSRFKLEGEEAMAMLRHVPEDDLIVLGDGVRKNRGKLERLGDQVDVERKGNEIDRKDAWRALQEAAARYRDAGLIE